MQKNMQRTGALLLALAAIAAFTLALAAAPIPVRGVQDGKDADLAKYKKLTADLLESVSSYTGIPIRHPVEVTVVTKEEVKEYILKLLNLEYPGDELERQGKALAMFGLLPEDYNIRTELVELVTEQVGAFYDPRTTTFYAISDLPPMFSNPMVERTITAHELVHALQDQALGLKERMDELKKDSDRSYALQALMEGQASVVMMGVMNGVRGDKLPDLTALMRQSMEMSASMVEMQVFNRSPEYMRETLISPYAEGAGFVQAFLRKNPEANLADMFARIPISAEQVLHIEKYTEDDLPHDFDLNQAEGLMPGGWELYHANTLGEFDVRVLASLHESTAAQSVEIGAGWDGIEYAVFRNGESLALLGVSAWDGAADAEEFAAALKTALEARNGAEGIAVRLSGDRVSFLAGDIASLPAETLLSALERAPAMER